MTVDFVIINYHCTDDVSRLIAEITTTCPIPYTITVIDNSLDNRGFSVAANLGANLGSGDLIAFLNPDIHLVPCWMDETLGALRADEGLVIAGPRLDDGYGWPRVSKAVNGIKDWVCGAAFFVRRSFFERVGGFDERFFFTYEETDLCRQAEDMGLRVETLNVQRPVVKHIRHDTVAHGEYLLAAQKQYHQKWGCLNA
jgi:GT2 family glycosyltransferase